MGTPLEAQWSRLCASKARGLGSSPGWETKIPYGVRRGQKKKKEIHNAYQLPVQR